MSCSRRRVSRVLAAGLVAGTVAAACGDPAAGDTEVVVSAAASLTDAFVEIEEAYEAAHPGVDLVLNIGGSSALREQLLAGAPASVLATADTRTMADVAEAGLIEGAPRVFALNRLVIAVPAGNPAGVAGLEDLARPELLVGLCAEQVPCGAFARQALARAGVTASVDTLEPDVRALLTKVGEGELDAGITYVTDVAAAAGRVEGVGIPDELNVVAEYPIAVVAGAGREAAEVVEFVLSGPGQQILARHGFGSP